MFCSQVADHASFSRLAEDKGRTYWTSAQLALNVPWFLLSFCHDAREKDMRAHQDEPPMMVVTTELLSLTEDVQRRIAEHERGVIEIEALMLMTPGHVNGSSSWKMEPFGALWLAQEPSAPGGRGIEIYETAEGAKYSRYGTPAHELTDPVLLLRWGGQARHERSGH